MKTVTLMMVGGFLGAGKTTLLQNAAASLARQGLRVGLITNDRAPESVDGKLLSLAGIPVVGMNGNSFCCNFNGFIGAIEQICDDHGADIIIAEPVGSCVDLSASIMQPLKRYWNREVICAPLTVLADPARLGPILDGQEGGMSPEVAYIYRKQLEESDVILITKTDLLSADDLADLAARTAAAYTFAEVMTVSVDPDDEGVDDWIERMTTPGEAGKHLAGVDYETLAKGEALLGWLNGKLRLSGKETGWDEFTRELVARMAERFDTEGLAVGHVKVLTENGSRFVAGNFTGSADSVSIRGTAGSADEATITINARVETAPENLDAIVREILGGLTGGDYETEELAWRFLQPLSSKPTHRFTEVA